MNLRSVCDQNRSDCGRADELRYAAVAQNRVVPVIAIRNQILASLVFGKQAQSVAEVPAARPLAKVPAESRHVSNLRARSFVNSFGKCRIISPDTCVLG